MTIDHKAALKIAEGFVDTHLVVLCRELVELDKTGLFGNGKLHELRGLCAFAGASSQALSKGMVETAAVRFVSEIGTLK